jgi:hypothetical protein
VDFSRRRNCAASGASATGFVEIPPALVEGTPRNRKRAAPCGTALFNVWGPKAGVNNLKVI